MNNKRSNYKYLLMCLVFVVALIIIGVSLSYAFTAADITGEFNNTTIQAGTFEIETSLTNLEGLNASNMLLINENEIETESETIEFTAKAKNTNNSAGELNIYLKDVEISSNLVSNDFKWQLLMDNNIIASGSFNDVTTKGIVSKTKTSTNDIKYYDRYYLKSGISFNGYNESNFKIRIYLLNSSLDQSNLLNGNFQCKAGIEAYSTK